MDLLSAFQRQRVRDLLTYDYNSRNQSFGNDFFSQPGDWNFFQGSGGGQSNVHQGKNRNSLNYGELNERGNNNLLQHGGENVGIGGGKSFFNWQGAGDYSNNYSRSNADKFINWQRGQTNVSDGSQSKRSDIWQGGYADNTKNVAVGGKERSRITQVGGKNAWNFADAGKGRGEIYQKGGDGSTHAALGGKGDDKITQVGDNSDMNIKAGRGDDQLKVNGDHNNLDLKAGRGDDTVRINGDHNDGNVNLGRGNDKLYVDGDKNNLTINGGKGDDSAYFNGSADDYKITKNDDGSYSVADRNNPESVTTLNDVEHLNFKNADGEYEEYKHPEQ